MDSYSRRFAVYADGEMNLFSGEASSAILFVYTSSFKALGTGTLCDWKQEMSSKNLPQNAAYAPNGSWVKPFRARSILVMFIETAAIKSVCRLTTEGVFEIIQSCEKVSTFFNIFGHANI